MINLNDLVGVLMQSGMSKSTTSRVGNALGGAQKSGGGGLGDLLGSLGGAGGIGDALGGLLAGGGGGSKALDGLGGMLGSVLGDAGKAVGGKQNLALGGLGALAGALFGGGGKSVKGALGGGAMALLGALAFSALKGSGQKEADVPLGLREPQGEAETQELEGNAKLVLKAMINAAKADGQIDEAEMQRIVGKLKEGGVDREMRDYVLAEMRKPLDLDRLTAAAAGKPELGAQLYAASLMAIEVDTPGEKAYMQNLADGVGLSPEIAARIKQMVGL